MAILKRVTGDPAGQFIELKGDADRHRPLARVPDRPRPERRQPPARRDPREGDEFFLVDLNSRNMTKVNNAEVDPGNDHRAPAGRPDQHLRRRVRLLHRPARRSPAPEDGDVMVVTEGDDVDDPNLHTLDASRSSALASAVQPEVKLKAILEISRNLSSDLKIDTVAPKILDSLMELFPQAERLFLVLIDPETKRLSARRSSTAPTRGTPFGGAVPDDEVPMSISRSIVNHVLGQKKAVLSQDAGNDKNLPTSASIADLKIRSVMCVPLLTPDGQALGIIQLDTSDRKQFLQEDLDVLAAVASQAAIAIQNAAMHETLLERERLERDLKLAEQVQKRFLPQSVPKSPATSSSPTTTRPTRSAATTTTSSPCPDDRLAIALGDVSGKGVAAALMMAKFSGDTRFCILTEDSPGRGGQRC